MQQPQLGRRILDLRLRADLSAEQLGRVANVSGATISRIETGRIRAPSFEILQRLAGALGFKSVDAMLAADKAEQPAAAANASGEAERPVRAIATSGEDERPLSEAAQRQMRAIIREEFEKWFKELGLPPPKEDELP